MKRRIKNLNVFKEEDYSKSANINSIQLNKLIIQYKKISDNDNIKKIINYKDISEKKILLNKAQWSSQELF